MPIHELPDAASAYGGGSVQNSNREESLRQSTVINS